MYKEIQISKKCNGYLITVGCKDFVLQNPVDLSRIIVKFFDEKQQRDLIKEFAPDMIGIEEKENDNCSEEPAPQKSRLEIITEGGDYA